MMALPKQGRDREPAGGRKEGPKSTLPTPLLGGIQVAKPAGSVARVR